MNGSYNIESDSDFAVSSSLTNLHVLKKTTKTCSTSVKYRSKKSPAVFFFSKPFQKVHEDSWFHSENITQRKKKEEEGEGKKMIITNV